MNCKKKIALLVLMAGLTSAYASAGVSTEFKNHCNATTGRVVEGVRLIRYFSDTNTNSKGVYVTSPNDGTWLIQEVQNHNEAYLSAEMRKIALSAVLSNIKVNMCTSSAYTPNHIWAIELDADL